MIVIERRIIKQRLYDVRRFQVDDEGIQRRFRCHRIGLQRCKTKFPRHVDKRCEVSERLSMLQQIQSSYRQLLIF